MVKKIPISGETIKKREQVAATIADNFTLKEINAMTDGDNTPEVKIGKLDKGKSGSIDRKDVNRDNTTVITISKDADKDTIVHEFVHHSRTVDKNRRGIARTAYSVDDKGRTDYNKTNGISYKERKNAEESATVSETTTRMKEPTLHPSHYYAEVGKKDQYSGQYPDRHDNYRHDRKVLRRYSDGTGVPDGKTVKGVNALKMFIRNYKSTLMSRKELGGKTSISISEKIASKEKK